MSRAFWLALGTLGALLFSTGEARAQNPTAPGPYAVSSAEYDKGDEVPLECDPGVANLPCNGGSCDGQCQMNCNPTTGGPDICMLTRPTTDFRASVYYPTLSQLTPGQKLPLVVFVHGRHAACANPTTGIVADPNDSTWPCPVDEEAGTTVPIPSYRGYNYIANVLASHGYIVASISLNAIDKVQFFVGDMVQERAALIEQHLREWSSIDTTGDSTLPEPFATQLRGHVDLQRVGTMGHSRGGAAVVNHFQNYAAASPFKVRAVMPIAPLGTSDVINGVPLGVLMSYCDGQLITLPGLNFYDKARYSVPGDPSPKHVFLARPANHNYFNMAWTPECWDNPAACPLFSSIIQEKPCAAPTPTSSDCQITDDDWNQYELGNAVVDPYCHEANGARLTPAEQRDVGIAYVTAFFRRYLGQETAFGPLLRGDVAAPIDAADEVFVQYQPPASERLDLDTFVDATGIDYTTLTGQACTTPADCPGGQCVNGLCHGDLLPDDLTVTWCADCYTTLGPFEVREAHGGVVGRAKVTWTADDQSYLVQLPPGARNVSQFGGLQFRVGVDFESAENPQNDDVRFSVVLHSGTAQAVATSDSQLGNNDLWKAPDGHSETSVLGTLRVPFSAFTTTAGFSFANVSDVTFLFDQQAAGTLFVSDLQFTDTPTCSDGLQNHGETGLDCGGPCPACVCTPTTYQAETMFHSIGNPAPDGWNIFGNGFISTSHTFAAGANSLTVTARGQSANGVAPHMVVSVGGVAVGNTFVTSTTFAPFTFTFTTSAGTRDIAVAFDNDFFAPPQDRNLFVDKVVVHCPSSGSTCTEATAVDLGAPGNNVSVPVGGCVRVRDAYPPWWTTRTMKLENPASGSYPVPFTWTNTCSGSSGSGSFTGAWQAKLLSVTNAACATLIDLTGTGTGNVTLRYWSN